MTLTYLVTKHLSTSSCLQTNSMNRGEVMLDIREEKKIKKEYAGSQTCQRVSINYALIKE